MAATETVSQSPESLQPRHGVVTLFGYGVAVRVDRGHLLLECGIGPDRRYARLPRVGQGLRRLVCISEDGFLTLSALKWLSDVGASLVMLDRVGKVLFVTGPCSPSESRLRRAQGLALGNGIGLEISRTLINAKLEGQERVARDRLNDACAADEIAIFRKRLPEADTHDAIRWLEAHAALAYFAPWHDIPVLWPKADLRRIPEHWRKAGSRRSPLSGGPRLAVTPVHAILNYCFALLESESRLALSALGLDPGLGVGLHTDTANRDSLALDVLEPVRPQVESWVLDWIAREPLRRADFFETTTGNCRLMASLCAKLGQTAPVWGKLVAPWAEYVARTFWSRTSQSKARRSLPTPLTQQHRREAKGRPSFPTVEAPKPDRLCRGCGKQIRSDKRFCSDCAVTVVREGFDVGRKIAQRPEFLAKRAATQRMHKQAIQNWKPSGLPGCLTRDVYVSQVQPALASVAKSRIRPALGVSEPYASGIQAGKRVPHPRHWEKLAELVGVSPNVREASNPVRSN
jgi:CRISPR-associated protein Cas1